MVSYIAAVSAFFLSGRFIRTVRRGPSSLTMTRSAMCSPILAHILFGKPAATFPGYALVRQCLAGGVDGVAAVDDRGREAVGGSREVGREKPRDAYALRRSAAIAAGPALRGERVLRQHAASGGDAEQPQVRGRAGQRLLGRLVEVREQPVRRMVKARDRLAEPFGGGPESRIVGSLHLGDGAAKLVETGAHGGAARERQLAGDEVDRLDAVGAFVDLRNAGIPIVLRGAGLLDIAHTAVHLNAERGDFSPDVGRERLGDRRQERSALVRGLSLGVARGAVRAVARNRRRTRDRARRIGQPARGYQHLLCVC